MTDYVVGFVVNYCRDSVLLVRKEQPEWQKGLLNGIGGKVEPGETPLDAIAREFDEETETYIAPEEWREVVTLRSNGHTITFFAAELPYVHMFAINGHKNDVGEYIELRTISNVLDRPDKIPNLSWLLPLAAYAHDSYAPFTVYEVPRVD